MSLKTYTAIFILGVALITYSFNVISKKPNLIGKCVEFGSVGYLVLEGSETTYRLKVLPGYKISRLTYDANVIMAVDKKVVETWKVLDSNECDAKLRETIKNPRSRSTDRNDSIFSRIRKHISQIKQAISSF